MASRKFRKLNLYLPRQPIRDQRPWLVAGLLLAVVILLMCIYAYFSNVKKKVHPQNKPAQANKQDINSDN